MDVLGTIWIHMVRNIHTTSTFILLHYVKLYPHKVAGCLPIAIFVCETQNPMVSNLIWVHPLHILHPTRRSIRVFWYLCHHYTSFYPMLPTYFASVSLDISASTTSFFLGWSMQPTARPSDHLATLQARHSTATAWSTSWRWSGDVKKHMKDH